MTDKQLAARVLGVVAIMVLWITVISPRITLWWCR